MAGTLIKDEMGESLPGAGTPSSEQNGQRMAARFAETINQAVPGAVASVNEGVMPSVTVPAGRLIQVCTALKKGGFDYLDAVTAVDYYSYFEVIYHLLKTSSAEEICIKVLVGRDQPVVPSLYHLWQGADFQEREIFDLMGITFSGHPNLKRILLWDEFVGHPLRKDFGLNDQSAWHQMPPMPQLEV